MPDATAPARLRVLHVVVQAGPTNCQWNEHCLPVADERDVVVCSLFPATVAPDPRIPRFEGDGTVAGAMRVLRTALRRDGYDVVHVHAPASAALLLAACVLEHRSRRDIVFTLHNSWPNLRPRNRLLAAVAIAAFPYVVCCSSSAAATVPGHVRARARHGITVVPNGVDVDRVTRALRAPAATGSRTGDREEGSREGRFTFITVGRLIPIKDQTSLLRAFARMSAPGDRLVIIGEGPLRVALEQRAEALGIADQVQFLGLVPRDEVYRRLADADAFVSPSRGEGLPLSVMEAMATGLPVVVSDIAPHREIAEGTSDPVLVPVGDVARLAREMRRVRDASPRTRTAVGARNRQWVSERFSLASMTAGYQAVYTTVAAASGRRVGRAGQHGAPRSAAPPALVPAPRAGDRPADHPADRSNRPPQGGHVREHLDLDDAAGGVRTRLWLPALAALVGGALGFWFSVTLPVVHRSEATLLVGPTNGSVTHSSTVSASQELAAFYADMARRELVLRPVAQELGNGTSWVALRNNVSAVVPPQNLRIVTVTVMDDSQQVAQREANLIIRQIVGLSPAPPGGNQQAFVNRQAADLQTSIDDAQARISELKADRSTQISSAGRESLDKQINAVETQVSDWQKTYVELIGVDPTSDAGSLQVLDHATPVTDAGRSGTIKLTLVGALAGGIIGTLGAWKLYRRDRRRQLAARLGRADGPSPAGSGAEADDDVAEAASMNGSSRELAGSRPGHVLDGRRS